MPRHSIKPAMAGGDARHYRAAVEKEPGLIVGDQYGPAINQAQGKIGLARPFPSAQQHANSVDQHGRSVHEHAIHGVVLPARR
jgi:hypothetical protein